MTDISQARNFKRTKYACFYTYLAMSSIFSFPPMLFITFKQMYGISYTLLGTLVLINFLTQLTVDLIFTFFTKLFNVRKVLRVMPLLTTAGLLIYALVPLFEPKAAYAGFVTGTVIFSIAAGLCEVLLSPVMAAIPSETPERDMSFLHSLYAWGVVSVVLISSVYLAIFGTDNWMYLALFWAALPLGSFILFSISPMPEMDLTPASENGSKRRNRGIILCVFCIFLGSAAENSMTNWISSYVETALGISKAVGDILGLALFAVLLGLGRTLYAKYGRNILKTLLFGMIGAVICYTVAGISPSFIVATVACVLTGLCTSMLWPGTLILMEEKYPAPGVTAYALMAAGGDFGASIAPQMLGIVVDTVAASSLAASLGEKFSLTPDQIGMKVGMLAAAIFPLIGIGLLLYMKRYFKREEKSRN